MRGRFRAFFEALPEDIRQHLTENFLVWVTNWEELIDLGLADRDTRTATYPSREQIARQVERLSIEERLDAVIDFFYFVRRNPYTHAAEYHQLVWLCTQSGVADR